MNILVIESSPHKNGSSNLLAEHFIYGARRKQGIRRRFLTPRAPIFIPALPVTAAGCRGNAAKKTIWQGCGNR